MIFNKGDLTLPVSVTIADAERCGRICARTLAKAFTSLKAQNRKPRDLFETLVEEANTAEDLSQRRLYLNAVLGGAKVFPEEASLSLASAGNDDVVTQHHLETEMQKLQDTF